MLNKWKRFGFSLVIVLAANAKSAMAVDIQALIDAVLTAHSNPTPENRYTITDMPKITLPEGVHTVTAPLDCRGFWGLTIEGAGYGTIIRPDFTGSDIGKPIIDATGATRMVLRNLRITNGPSAATNYGAGTGVLLARFTSGASAGLHRFDNVAIEGPYSVAALVNSASESNTFTHCAFLTHSAGGNAVLICNSDLSGSITGISSIGTSTMLTADFINCLFAKPVTEAGTVAPIIQIQGIAGAALGDIHFNVGNLYFSKFGGEGGADADTVILLKNDVESGNQFERIFFEGLRSEAEEANHFIKAVIDSTRIIGRIHVEECSVYSKQTPITHNGTMTQWDVNRTFFYIADNTDCTTPGSGTCLYPIVECTRLWYSNLNFLYSGELTNLLDVSTGIKGATIIMQGANVSGRVTIPGANVVDFEVIERGI